MPASRLAFAVTPNPSRHGAPLTLALVLDGQVAGEWVGIDGVDVVVERRAGGAWEKVETVTTDESGEADVTGLVADRVADYRASYDGTHAGKESSFAAASPSVKLEVVRTVGGESSKAGGGKLRLSGAVAPAYAGGTVLLQKKVGKGGWKTVKKTKADAKSRWSFKVPAKPDKPTRYRAVVKESGRFSTSYGRTIKVKGR